MEKPKYELKKIYIKEDIKNKIIYNVEEHIQNYKNINSIIFGKPEIIKYKFSDCLCKVGNKWKMSVAILNKFLEKNILDSYGRNIAHYISTFNGTHKFLS